MKLRRLLVLALAAITLASCGKNDISSVIQQISSNPGSSTITDSSTPSETTSPTSSQSANNSTSNSGSSSTSSGSSSTSSNSSTTSPTIVDETAYYQGTNLNLTGDALRKEIYTLMTTTQKVRCSYDDLKKYIPIIDAVPGKKNTIYLFYTAEEYYWGEGTQMSFSGLVNREHTWPNSRGAGKSGPGSDPFLLQPTWAADNSSRGNSAYADPGEGGWTPDMDEYKGDAARLMFYAATHYGLDSSYGLKLVDNTTETNKSMGKLSTLLKWNLENPVNHWEETRNDNAQGAVGNRNPFVDHPELACQIWGETNDATRKVCSSKPVDPPTPAEPTAVSSSNISLSEGSTATIKATITPANATDKDLTYVVSDSTIAAVSSSGVVTGLKVGETDVTISLTNFPEVKTTIKVTVTEKSADPVPPVGGNTITLDKDKLGVTSSEKDGEATIDGITFAYEKAKFVSNNVFIKDGGAFYNTTSIGNITSIKITYGSGGSEKSTQSISIDSEMIPVNPGEYHTILDSSKVGETGVITVSETGNGFFRIDVSVKNLQFSSIEITYSN